MLWWDHLQATWSCWRTRTVPTLGFECILGGQGGVARTTGWAPAILSASSCCAMLRPTPPLLRPASDAQDRLLVITVCRRTDRLRPQRTRLQSHSETLPTCDSAPTVTPSYHRPCQIMVRSHRPSDPLPLSPSCATTIKGPAPPAATPPARATAPGSPRRPTAGPPPPTATRMKLLSDQCAWV